MTASRCTNLYMSFKIVGKCTPEHLKLFENYLIKNAVFLNERDYRNIYKEFFRIDSIDSGLQQSLIAEFPRFKNSVSEFYMKSILCGMIKFGCPDETLSEIENELIKSLNSLSVLGHADIAHTYVIYYKDYIKLPCKRREFIEKIEDSFYKNRPTFILNNYQSKKSEAIIMWAFSEALIYNHKDMWEEFDRNMINFNVGGGLTKEMISHLKKVCKEKQYL